MSTQTPPSAGLFHSLKVLALTVVATIETRLQIASTEIEEERIRLGQLLVLLAALIVTAVIGVILLTLFLIVLFWDTPARNWVFGSITLAYLVAAGVIFGSLKHRLQRRSPLFAATLAELA